MRPWTNSWTLSADLRRRRSVRAAARHSGRPASRAAMRSSTLSTWYPRGLATTSLVSPAARAKAASLQLRRKLAAAEDAHRPPRARLRGARAGLGEGGEALGGLLETAHDIARFVRRRHEDLAQPDPLRRVEVMGVVAAMGVQLGVGQAHPGEDGLRQQPAHGLAFLLLAVAHGRQPARTRLQHEDPLLEVRLQERPPHVGVQRAPAPRLDRRHVALEVAAPDGLVARARAGRGPRRSRRVRPGRRSPPGRR